MFQEFDMSIITESSKRDSMFQWKDDITAHFNDPLSFELMNITQKEIEMIFQRDSKEKKMIV